jgi:chromate transport protein ChrA
MEFSLKTVGAIVALLIVLDAMWQMWKSYRGQESKEWGGINFLIALVLLEMTDWTALVGGA